MKLIMAIINGEDAKPLIKSLMSEGFQVTKLASSGGFLKAKNTTILCGVTNEYVDACLAVIKKVCRAKTYSPRKLTPEGSSTLSGIAHGRQDVSQAADIVYGGATVFVMDIERHEKY
jgi:uncharacterized protein YaaQ